jgi:hypothetical protein
MPMVIMKTATVAQRAVGTLTGGGRTVDTRPRAGEASQCNAARGIRSSGSPTAPVVRRTARVGRP